MRPLSRRAQLLRDAAIRGEPSAIAEVKAKFDRPKKRLNFRRPTPTPNAS